VQYQASWSYTPIGHELMPLPEWLRPLLGKETQMTRAATRPPPMTRDEVLVGELGASSARRARFDPRM
jgi:hypothetical protein